jgi:hypothetical protein
MKKFTFLMTLLIVLTINANTQIPNPGFENWYNSANGFDPVGWITSNATPFVSVERATPGYQGNFAVKVKTWMAGIIVAPGTCQSDAFYYTSRPESLSGFVKCTIVPGDSASIVITVTQGGINGVGVGAARKVFNSSISSYTAFNLPIYYDSSAATDTIYIDIIAGRQATPSLGTEIIVDELSLSSATGIDNAKAPLSDQVGQNYPNPAKEFTIIPLNLANAGNINIKIFDLFGREIKTVFNEAVTSGDHQLKFSVAELPGGIYFCTIKGDNFTGTRKFTVSK